MQYRVLSDTSTRASADPRSPRFDQWVHFPAGTTVSEWPRHAPVDEWVASGHWQAADQAETPPEEGEPA